MTMVDTRTKDLFGTHKKHDAENENIRTEMEQMTQKVASVDQNLANIMAQMEQMLSLKQAIAAR